MKRFTWAILSGEYPPQLGGVSDYTHQLAHALQDAGDRVHVFSRRFDLAYLTELSCAIDALGTDTRVLVQYVPHAFGFRAMNLPLCAWLLANRLRWNIDVMFHEVAYPSGILGAVNRAMAKLVARSARRIFISTLVWKNLIDAAAPVRWLAVPSNLPTVASDEKVREIRGKMGEKLVIGHFGDRGKWTAPLLRPVLAKLGRGDRQIILIGRDTRDLGLCNVITTGAMSAPDTAAHLAACDVMVQPYSDGISARRSSAMAALALGVPIVSALGSASEPIWRESNAVALANGDAPDEIAATVERTLADENRRREMSRRGRVLYDDHFALAHTIRALRQED